MLRQRTWRGDETAEIRAGRKELEREASPANIKRAAGGTLDVEYLVQMLQLKHAGAKLDVLKTNTQSAIAALADADALETHTAEMLGDAYRFLRRVESGLRLLDTSARHNLPTDPTEMRRLALLLGHGNPDRLRDQCLHYMTEIRAREMVMLSGGAGDTAGGGQQRRAVAAEAPAGNSGGGGTSTSTITDDDIPF